MRADPAEAIASLIIRTGNWINTPAVAHRISEKTQEELREERDSPQLACGLAVGFHTSDVQLLVLELHIEIFDAVAGLQEKWRSPFRLFRVCCALNRNRVFNEPSNPIGAWQCGKSEKKDGNEKMRCT